MQRDARWHAFFAHIYFYQSLMADIRKSIEEDRFMSFSKEFLESYKS